MTDPVESAKAAGLRYVTDTKPGLRRLKAARGFRYVDAEGKPVRDAKTLKRIRSLAIPPAWTDVWICPTESGHIQATARDAKGRKQYRYHPRWREVRDETKFGRMIAFGAALPKIRERVEQDLALPGLPREKVLAAVVRLLEKTLIRVGNEEYARQNGSFGLTTMRDEHVDVSGSKLCFDFRGKSGKDHHIEIKDGRLARVVKKCQDIPGHELFQYLDEEGGHQTIDSGDVNQYLRDVTGEDFTAKDFRTWNGTVLAALALDEFEKCDSEAQAKKNVVQAIERVSERLGNTPSVCRKCYVHPEVINAYMDGTLAGYLRDEAARTLRESLHELSPEEAAVVAMLEHRLAGEASKAA